MGSSRPDRVPSRREVRSLRPIALAFVLVLLLALPAVSMAAPPALRAGTHDEALRAWLAEHPQGAEVLVRFHGEAVGDAELGLLARLDMPVLFRYSAIPAVWTRGSALAIAELTQDARVAYVEPNLPLAYALEQSVGEIGARQGRTPGVWETLGVEGSGVTVAVIDSGVDATHPDLPLGSKVVQNVKIVQPVVGGPTSEVTFANGDWASGHGTHVAGTVAGTGAASAGAAKGVAPGASIVGVGAGEGINIAFATQALDWTWRHVEAYGIDIATNSWGPSGGSSYNANGAIEQAIKRLHDKGVVVLFAVGNDGTTTTGDRQWGRDTLSGYAMSPYAIGVASYNSRTGVLSDFSSRGDPTKASLATKTGAQRRPDIAGPGEDIAAAAALTGGAASLVPRVPGVSDYVRMSGTSMATPHVAGAAALVIDALESRGCAWTPATVQQALYRTARGGFVRTGDGTPAAAHDQGRGPVDAYAAVQLAQTAPTCDLASAPLPAPYPSTVARVVGDLHLYQGGRIDPFGLLGGPASRTRVVAGEPVSIASRSTRSVDAAYPISVATQGEFRIHQADGQEAPLAVLPITNALEETLSTGISFDWNGGRILPQAVNVPGLGPVNPSVPNVFPLLPAGDYVIKAWLDTGGGVLIADELPITVVGSA